MHDLRTAPRWSKTAVVVVLVVFSLVLVVAVFGLLAFKSDQDARAVKARNAARVKAHTLLGELVGQVGKRFNGVILRAGLRDDGLAQSGSAEEQLRGRLELRQYVDGPVHGRLVRAVVRIDPTVAAGVVDWPGGRYHLFLGQQEIEARAERQAKTRAKGHALFARAREVEIKQGAVAALAVYRELVRRYGLLAYVDESEAGGAWDPDSRIPYGLSWAVEMLRVATNALTADPEAVPGEALHDVILRALETALLHQGRARMDDLAQSKLAAFEIGLARTLAKVPEARRGLLAWEAAQFRGFREAAVAGMPPRGHLLSITREAAERGPGRYVLTDSQLAPYGVDTDHRRSIVVLLDAQAVAAEARAALQERARAFEGLGVVARMRDVTAAPDPDLGSPDGSVLFGGQVTLPYRLDFWQTGPPQSIADPRADNILFLAVIGLAIAGLIVGGYVLLRLLTREIRLAQLKADFVSNLSHELKTPITSISLFTEMLEEGKLMDAADQHEAFGVLGQESRRLQRIVHRMIDVARGEARRNPYDLAPGDLNEPVREAVSRQRRIVKDAGLDLALRLHPEPLHVQMDGTAMDDAVTNLLSNAWKYKREDRARIVVQTLRRGRHAEIVVGDDGIGIPRRERRKVFEMFYRAEQYLTQPVAGTGLGLALVRSVAAGHRGRVRIEAGEGGRGTTFRIRIPLDGRAAAALAEATPPETGRSATEAPSHGKLSGPGPSVGSPSPEGLSPEDPSHESQVRRRASNPGAPS